MQKVIILAALSILSSAAIANASEPVEVSSLIKCETSYEVMGPANTLNSEITATQVSANLADFSEIYIKAPFNVSAPAIYSGDGRKVTICVTLTKK